MFVGIQVYLMANTLLYGGCRLLIWFYRYWFVLDQRPSNVANPYLANGAEFLVTALSLGLVFQAVKYLRKSRTADFAVNWPIVSVMILALLTFVPRWLEILPYLRSIEASAPNHPEILRLAAAMRIRMLFGFVGSASVPVILILLAKREFRGRTRSTW